MSTFFFVFFENFPKNLKKFLFGHFGTSDLQDINNNPDYFATIKKENPERMARIAR